MTGYYLATATPILYLALAAIVGKLVRDPICRAMDIEYDRSDTDEFVMAAVFIVLAGLAWPLTLLLWLAIPRRPKGKHL
ncbi:hypothetical protein [Streptomyces sp. BH105]|uniref:hypothetical protein n=1 Tax=Streptomyces sp. BH105 TaxID=3410408 RepID=UPI003CED16D5